MGLENVHALYIFELLGKYYQAFHYSSPRSPVVMNHNDRRCPINGIIMKPPYPLKIELTLWPGSAIYSSGPQFSFGKNLQVYPGKSQIIFKVLFFSEIPDLCSPVW